jgi:hypothetical protein
VQEQLHWRWAFGPRPLTGADESSSGGWVRTAHPRVLDEELATVYCDAWPPPVLGLVGRPHLIPTLEMVIYFLWAADGTLIAQGRQLRLVVPMER